LGTGKTKIFYLIAYQDSIMALTSTEDGSHLSPSHIAHHHGTHAPAERLAPSTEPSGSNDEPNATVPFGRPVEPSNNVNSGFSIPQENPAHSYDPNQTSRRRSIVSMLGFQPEIHWHPPAKMISALLVGLLSSAALHCYYSSLDGTLVGGSEEQQRALRIGTALAWFAQTSLVFSIQISFVQWLWRELKSHIISFEGIDAAFAATTDPTAFVRPEIWSKVKVASTLALVSWLIPIASLIAPATLNVEAVIANTTKLMNISTLDIAQADSYERFAYAVDATPAPFQKFLSPRTIVTRLAVATATTGNILDLREPATNASYQQSFFGPYMDCKDSSTGVQKQIDGMRDEFNKSLDPTLELVSLDYFAAIPALSGLGNDTGSHEQIEAADIEDIDFALHASNQLWLYFPTFNSSESINSTHLAHYLTCRLHNASYTTHFEWTNGQQKLELLNLTVLEPILYPTNASNSTQSEATMAYSAFAWALSNQLTGTIAFYKDTNDTHDVTEETFASHEYSLIQTGIAQTVLLGTSDLDSHFAQNHYFSYDGSKYSDQRKQDMAYAGHRPLDILIPELSTNITLSLITDSLLA
jgi:hypothetical protein